MLVTGLAATAALATSAVPSVAAGSPDRSTAGSDRPVRADLPTARLPRPTGPFGVGSTILHLVDRSRTDPWAPDASPYRELMVSVRYPAAPRGAAPRVPQMPAAAPPTSAGRRAPPR